MNEKRKMQPPTAPEAIGRHLGHRTAPRYPDQVPFSRHIRQIFESVGVIVPELDLAMEVAYG
ncbi:MAG: hypothetical protein ABSH48_28075 [Verrucomicrobiota bacterium]|jgi:hypothetical protein